MTFHIPEDDYMKPWTFTSSDGRFEMDIRAGTGPGGQYVGAFVVSYGPASGVREDDRQGGAGRRKVYRAERFYVFCGEGA